MYEFRFDGFSAEQCNAYLKRIGADFNGEATLENLNDLIVKHQSTVPFENLALISGWGTVDLAPDSLYKKIVEDHRGGFCFELNGAFTLLLKGLGYDVVGVMARVGLPFLGFLTPLYHRGILVTIEGNEYYCDVGMGGPKPAFAVPMTGEKLTKYGKKFWIEDTERGWKMLKNDYKGSDGSCLIFAPVPMLPSDFYGNCRELLNDKNTIFYTMRQVNLTLIDGYIQIVNNTLTIQKGDKKEEREFDEAEFPSLLKELFQIDFPG